MESFEPSRFVEGGTLLIAGSAARYAPADTGRDIPKQWMTFAPHIGHVPGQVAPKVSYGVVTGMGADGKLEYVCGVEVANFDQIPEDWARVTLGSQQYAVFTHRDHVSKTGETWKAIYSQWLPQSGYQEVHAPSFELYDQRFHPETGTGEFEIWIPVIKR